MISRRGLLSVAGATVAISATGCSKLTNIGTKIGKVHNFGGSGLDNSGKPWSYAKTGNKERFEIRPGDHVPADKPNFERTEVAHYKFSTFGKEVWLSYSLLLEAGQPSTAPWLMLSQWHGLNDPWDVAIWPPIGMYLAEEKLHIDTSFDPHWVQTDNQPRITRYIGERFERGVWHHFVHAVRFDPDGAGRLRIWIDGRPVVDVDNVAIGFRDLLGPYIKHGLYRNVGDDSRQVAWFANFEVGPTSLEGRIANPLPL